MLKIAYSEVDIAIELLDNPIEAMVAQRSILALRLGQAFVVQASYGSLLLPTQLPGLSSFLNTVADNPVLTVAPCDFGWLEITLQGVWIAAAATCDQGILIVNLGYDLELQLANLWQASLSWAAEAQPIPKAC